MCAKMKRNLFSGGLLISFAVVFGFVCGVSVEQDLTLTLKEKTALDKFRSRVVHNLTDDYMKQDIYLIRWLRARNLNVDAAEALLRQNLKWREANRLSTILTEDWSDMTDDFPYETDAFDRAGRPVGTFNIGSWNFRRIALTGKMSRLLRYMDGMLETATQSVITLQNQGQNVTQWKVILNMEGFSIVQHACPICLPAYVTFISSYEQHYPGYADALVLINTPPAFQIILELVRPVFSAQTQQALKVFGTDKRQWKSYLDKEIDEKQLRPDYGGTKLD